MVSPRVTDEEQSRLTESCLDLISKCSRGETTSDGAAANISEKEDYSLVNCNTVKYNMYS